MLSEVADVGAAVRADRDDRHAGRDGREVGDDAVERGRLDEIDLVDDDDRRRAAVPHRDQVALEAPHVGVAVGGRDDEERVDVGGDDLALRALSRRPSGELAFPRQDIMDHGRLVAGRHRERDPVTHGG
jgi:hypothetical protein